MTEFTAKIRASSVSLEVTIPKDVVELLKLKDGDICKLTIEKER